MFEMLYFNCCMEIAESIGWIALGFLPMCFGSMEVAWRLGKRRKSFKPNTKKGTIIKKGVCGCTTQIAYLH
jgi:hypothetical protein